MSKSSQDTQKAAIRNGFCWLLCFVDVPPPAAGSKNCMGRGRPLERVQPSEFFLHNCISGSFEGFK